MLHTEQEVLNRARAWADYFKTIAGDGKSTAMKDLRIFSTYITRQIEERWTRFVIGFVWGATFSALVFTVSFLLFG